MKLSSLEHLRLASGAQITATRLLMSKVRDGPEEWFVMRLPEVSGTRAESTPESTLLWKAFFQTRNVKLNLWIPDSFFLRASFRRFDEHKKVTTYFSPRADKG